MYCILVIVSVTGISRLHAIYILSALPIYIYVIELLNCIKFIILFILNGRKVWMEKGCEIEAIHWVLPHYSVSSRFYFIALSFSLFIKQASFCCLLKNRILSFRFLFFLNIYTFYLQQHSDTYTYTSTLLSYMLPCINT